MVPYSHFLFALASLVHLGHTKPLSTPTYSQNPDPVVRNVQTQTPTLISDFKKKNVSASWAAGQPMQWGSEVKNFEYPVPASSKARFYGTTSDDEKFLYLSNGTDFKIIDMATGTVATERKHPSPDHAYSSPPFLKNPKGGYDLLVPAQNDSYQSSVTLQMRLADNGTLMDPETWGWFSGVLTYSNPRATNGDGMSKDRKIVTIVEPDSYGNSTSGQVYVYSLDDPKVNLTIELHGDLVYDCAFSPDGKLLSTADGNGLGKLWDVATNKFISSFGPIPGRTMLTRFSPDGKFVLFARIPDAWAVNETDRIGDPNVHIYPVSSNSSRITIGPFNFEKYYEVFNIEWSPDGKKLAIGTYGQLQVYDVGDSAVKLSQNYTQEDTRQQIKNLLWLEGGKRLTYRVAEQGLGMYDFETNEKFWWGPGDTDHWDYFTAETLVLLKKGWIGGVESDQTVKFWQYPA